MSGKVWRVYPPEVAAQQLPLFHLPPIPSDQLELPEPPDTLLSDLDFVVVDVETTGGSAYRGHRLTEFAAVVMRTDGTVTDEYHTLVNPERPIPAFITALTRITHDMVRDAPRFADIADDVRRVLTGRVFVAHNCPFDWKWVNSELLFACGQELDERTLCTVKLARKVVPEVGSRSLGALTDYFGVYNEARHRAYGDARATAVLLRRLFERLEEREVNSWNALHTLLTKRAPRRKRRAMPTSMDVI